ncbi:unnamed protein product [Toxocara canis]|uniref:Uncharacterized protein n=1 Tax=Toxocara canis TaxID=6265 RepID=A0A183U9X6_TOXCA|nr:unnamed protein product [Toxocara canis]
MDTYISVQYPGHADHESIVDVQSMMRSHVQALESEMCKHVGAVGGHSHPLKWLDERKVIK